MVQVDDFTDPSSAPLPSRLLLVWGQKRVWVKAFETPPNQMLNSYGLAKYVTMDDKVVWHAMTQPLKSGALYMTEYASETAERRGVACNRWLKSLLDYLQYQLTPAIKKKNK